MMNNYIKSNIQILQDDGYDILAFCDTGNNDVYYLKNFNQVDKATKDYSGWTSEIDGIFALYCDINSSMEIIPHLLTICAMIGIDFKVCEYATDTAIVCRTATYKNENYSSVIVAQKGKDFEVIGLRGMEVCFYKYIKTDGIVIKSIRDEM